MDIAKPFVKWVGGKRSILKGLLERIPKNYTFYHEPFLGGGALFFALSPKKAYLSDINVYLITTYRTVRDDVDQLINELKAHKQNHSLEYFKEARIQLSKEPNSTNVSALFIYINKTCYNGLYRVNKSGLFNVPMGKYTNPVILDEDNLHACSRFLQNIEIFPHSFIQIKPEKEHFYYLDPPYHETYSSYDGSRFGNKEHIQLAKFCNDIDTAGGYFMLSNSDTKFVRKLYDKYNIEIIRASRFVSCKANERNKQDELIIRNYQ